METVSYESLLGVSFGLLLAVLAGVVVTAVAIALAALERRRLPDTVSVSLGLVLAGVVGYGIGVFAADPLSTASIRFTLAALVVGPVGVAAGRLGWRLATELPLTPSAPLERGRSLSADAIDAVDAMGKVTIRTGDRIREFDGYPPLDPQLRATLADGVWRLPADLPLSELEARLEDRLRTTYDLEAVTVAVDARGRATITAAPPSRRVAKRVPESRRAVSVRTLLPTGLGPGDNVLVVTESVTVEGTVLDTTPGSEPCEAVTPSMACSVGGKGRATVAVPTTDAEPILEATQARLVVVPSESTPTLDAISLLERDGTVVRRITLTEPLLDAVESDDTTLEVFAVRNDTAAATSMADPEWTFDPEPATLSPGVEAFVLDTDGSGLPPEPDATDRRTLEVKA
ncbi:hypothetical protein RBH26_10680 [Natronolimnohabitans sp. A-GB9]|uniref:hypothetical protein n=1 Tax=Natronolimnohabitans sp. A-GB9 TaxID=3069757 RepID=UPI0027B549D2|nr:hypothetical protein [Natronolimnohabitans sp. A-GB9]MDQ2050946.1 hypothetical protein [Natronolimnohabitans sp. A-GB9]